MGAPVQIFSLSRLAAQVPKKIRNPTPIEVMMPAPVARHLARQRQTVEAAIFANGTATISQSQFPLFGSLKSHKHGQAMAEIIVPPSKPKKNFAPVVIPGGGGESGLG